VSTWKNSTRNAVFVIAHAHAKTVVFLERMRTQGLPTSGSIAARRRFARGKTKISALEAKREQGQAPERPLQRNFRMPRRSAPSAWRKGGTARPVAVHRRRIINAELSELHPGFNVRFLCCICFFQRVSAHSVPPRGGNLLFPCYRLNTKFIPPGRAPAG
jgi:hypothetical protein